MKAFFFEKIKHIAHEGFCRKKISTSQAQFGQNKGFGQKVQVRKNQNFRKIFHRISYN